MKDFGNIGQKKRQPVINRTMSGRHDPAMSQC